VVEVGPRGRRVAFDFLLLMVNMDQVAKLALEDGSVFTGRAFGAVGEVDGEVVFNTSMTGYQEILTDPSYHGQIVAMTYPMIGNYGINAEDAESARPWVRGFVVRELSRLASNYRSGMTLDAYLAQNGVLGIEGVDTRALVRLTRERGALKGILSTTELDDARLVAKAVASPGLVGRDLTRDVMGKTAVAWEPGFVPGFGQTGEGAAVAGEKRPHVVALDFGMKWNIPRHLVESGLRVTVVPGSSPAEAVLEHEPDGIFLSNGPGDPGALDEATGMVRTLIKDAAEARGIPIFGICLGHQLLGQAFGGRTFKLKFGHRGANHPVRDERTGKVEITTQNHGFAVDPASLPGDVRASHVNLNDMTLEGLRHARLPVSSVQYHPEASAGPHDSGYLFAEFRRQIGG
jgi:carbamoyl-phosphate synthase small subunit